MFLDTLLRTFNCGEINFDGFHVLSPAILHGGFG
jgi:hypothetical protein